MVGPAATGEYVAEAKELANHARDHLGESARRCLTEAERTARQLDDNHVGTEHIFLGALDVDPELTERVAAQGVTRDLFLAQLQDEEGPSPAGRIPFTPRSLMIIGLAYQAARREHQDEVSARHLLVGTIHESLDWERRGYQGPHHLAAAAKATGTDLTQLEAALTVRGRSSVRRP